MNQVTNHSPWKVLFYTCAAVFAVTLDATILFVAFPVIRETYSDVSAADLSWVLNAYTIVVGSMLMPAGAYADKFGRKRIFLLGVVIFTLGSLLCGLSQGIWFLIFARALQGLGSALLIPTSLSLILASFQKEKHAIAIAIWSAVGALAAAVGPAIGSAIIHFLDWRWIFFINIPVGIWCWIGGRRVFEEARLDRTASVPPLLGVVLNAVAVALVSLAIVQGEGWGWSSAKTVSVMIAGIILFVLFVVIDSRRLSPLIDRSLFLSKNFRVANYATFIFGIAFGAMFLGSVLFLKEIWNYNIIEIGLAMTIGPLMVVPAAMLTGKYAGKHGHARPLLVGGILFSLASVIRIVTLDSPPDFLLLWVPAAILTGVGIGMILPSLSSSATFDLPPNRYSVGAGVNNSIRQLGSVFGVAFAVLCVGTENAHEISSFSTLYIGLVIASMMTALSGTLVKTVIKTA